VGQYLEYGRAEPVMLVHAATAPAARLRPCRCCPLTVAAHLGDGLERQRAMTACYAVTGTDAGERISSLTPTRFSTVPSRTATST